MSKGWECPRCGRIYGPNWSHCVKCNLDACEREKAGIPYKPIRRTRKRGHVAVVGDAGRSSR